MLAACNRLCLIRFLLPVSIVVCNNRYSLTEALLCLYRKRGTAYAERVLIAANHRSPSVEWYTFLYNLFVPIWAIYAQKN